jgi:hypothetical protein
MADNSTASVSCLPNTTYGGDPSKVHAVTGKSYVVFGKQGTDAIELSAIAAGKGGFIIIKSSKPSPLTSPALEIEWEYSSFVNSPTITKPPVPEAMADNSTASVSCLPNTTYDVSDVSRALIIKSSAI